jgi:hypothetical protein
LVDQRDHRAPIDAQRLAELLLNCSLASGDDVQHSEEGRREVDGAKRLRSARVYCAPDPEKELPGELGDRGIGRRVRHHVVRLLHTILSCANELFNK